MVIDAKLPPEDPAPLSVPPPAYAPTSEVSQDPTPTASHHPQQYPPSSSQTYSESPAVLPQWQNPGTELQSMPPPDAWVGRQYRNQLFAECARGNHDQTTSFGLCGIICAILLFPIGLIFLCIDTEKKCSRCGVRLN
ncbi:hypothetical protein BC827DRAFT_1373992 [Russula dissimulans]|nr:hypothetical protein BC827DRAFT_1373992 [Russula dissimulans]